MVSAMSNVIAQTTPDLGISLSMDKISYIVNGDVDNNGTVDQNDAIKIIITLKNTGAEPIITEEEFSSQDFRKLLNFMVMGDGGTVTALITANDLEAGDAQPPETSIVVVGGEDQLAEVVPAKKIPPGWLDGLDKKEVEIPNAHTLYTLPSGYICVKAVISMSTYQEIFNPDGGVDYAELGDFNFAGVIESNQVCFYLNSDEDGDGYYYPQPFGVNDDADCDDNDPDVNPGEGEMVGNGKDDDCNPLTSDDEPDEPIVCITDLSARPRSGQVQLVWTHVAGTQDYKILRGVNPSGPFVEIGTTQSTYSTYLDTSVVNGTTYYYSVKAVWDNGNSQCESNEFFATPASRSR